MNEKAWTDFKSTLINDYVPHSEVDLQTMLKDSCSLSSVNSSSSAYIRKGSPSRIVTHYFLSKVIQEKEISSIRVVEKKLAVRKINNDDVFDPKNFSVEETRKILSDETFLREEFKSTFEFFSGISLEPAEAHRDSVAYRADEYEIIIIAKRENGMHKDTGASTAKNWNELRDLVIAVPFDVGLAPDELNFAFDRTWSKIVIFDSEPAVYQDGIEAMVYLARNCFWRSQLTVDAINSDFKKWTKILIERAEAAERLQEEERKREKQQREQQAILNRQLEAQRIAEEKRAFEELVANKRPTDIPIMTTNTLRDVISWIRQGDFVVIHNGDSKHNRLYYYQGNKTSLDDVRVIHVDVSSCPGVLSAEEWPWHIRNAGCKKATEEQKQLVVFDS